MNSPKLSLKGAAAYNDRRVVGPEDRLLKAAAMGRRRGQDGSVVGEDAWRSDVGDGFAVARAVSGSEILGRPAIRWQGVGGGRRAEVETKAVRGALTGGELGGDPDVSVLTGGVENVLLPRARKGSPHWAWQAVGSSGRLKKCRC